MEVNEGSLKIELKQLPQYAAIVVLLLAWLNPNVLNDLTSKYLSNIVYLFFIILWFVYMNSFNFFRELFDVHKNENLHNYDPPAGTQKYHAFDGKTRVIVILQKETVIREVRREILLLGNGIPEVCDDGVQPTRGRAQGGRRGGRGTQSIPTHTMPTTTTTTTTIQDVPRQHDTHVTLRIVTSTVETDKHHWSYWLSYFGYETKKIERVIKDETITL